jgi:hypothetical protein
MYRSLFAGILIIFLNAVSLKSQDTVSILFIGNSYTFANLGTGTPELPLRLKEMGSLYGKTIITDYSGAGGLALEKHWKSGKAALKIKSGNYDYVVIQEQSLGTVMHADKFENYAQKFSELICENNAKPVFYMTWGRQNRPGMIDTISHEYLKMAEELDAVIAPCGFAWDMASTQYPKINLYWADHSHPRPEGVLLNTFVFYSTLFGEIPADPLFNFAFKDMIITEDTARQLLQIAHLATMEINYQLGDQF